MANDGMTVYRYWLERQKKSIKRGDMDLVNAAIEDIEQTPAYHADATRNGEQEPIIAIRSGTNKCKVTVVPGSEMYIGDLVNVFNEDWLCTELHTDEYGITYGELWMCNHVFVYQDYDGAIIRKPAIIDEGSYSKGSDKPIPVADGAYKCLISLDEESAVLYIDKRLSIDTILNQEGKPVLEVGKITWLDTKTNNFGTGSHILAFYLKGDVYVPERDNLELMICDYIAPQEEEPEVPSTSGYLVIEGRETIRIGTGRVYRVSAVDVDGNSCAAPANLSWSISGDDSIAIEPNGNECLVRIPASEKLVGTSIELTCIDDDSVFESANKEVVVISIG